MPGPASVGHGGTGLRDRQRTFYELQMAQDAPRQAYLDLVMGLDFTKTGNYAGNVYLKEFLTSDLFWAGRIRPIVGLEVMYQSRQTALTRVNRLGDIVAGTWFCDDGQVQSGDTVTLYFELPDSSDPASDVMEAHLLFTYSTRYEAAPQLALDVFTDGGLELWDDVHTPTFWTPEGVGSGSGIVVDQATRLRPGSRGSFSCQISPDPGGLGDGIGGGVFQGSLKSLGAHHHWFPIWYFTPDDMPAGLFPSIRIRGDASLYMLEDGVLTTVIANEILLEPTRGLWKKVLFVYLDPDTTGVPGAGTDVLEVHLRLFNDSGAPVTTGYVVYDDVELRPVYRYLSYDPGFELTSLPETEVKAVTQDFGEKTLGFGDIALVDVNGDNSLITAFGSLHPLSKPASLFVGGRFSDAEGDELLRDDWRGRFGGLVDGVTARPQEGRVALKLTDTRSLAYAQASANALREEDQPTMNPQDAGKVRPLLFGDTAVAMFRGDRVNVGEIDATSFGYEVIDPFVPVRDGVNVGLSYGWAPVLYPNEELANKQRNGTELSTAITGNTVANPTVVTTATRHGLTTGDEATFSGSDSTPVIDGRRTVTVIDEFTFSVAVNVTVAGTTGKLVSHADVDYSNFNTRFHLLRDVRDRRFNHQGEDVGSDFTIDFTYNGSPFTTAPIDVAGPAWRVAQDVMAAMILAGGTTVTVSYSEGGYTFTIATDGVATLDLNAKTGATAAKQVYKTILGFDTSKDHTGAFTYTSDDVLFTDPETDLIPRWPGGGYHDDDQGSIAGVADAAIDSPPAVAAWLLRNVLNVPASRIVLDTFRTAREDCLSSDFTSLLLFVRDGRTAVIELLALMDRAGVMDTLIDGEGFIRCQKHRDDATVRREFFDRDYLSLEMSKDASRLYKTVRAFGGYNAALDRFTTFVDSSTIDTRMEIKFGAKRVFELLVGLTSDVITGGLNQLGPIYGRLFGQDPTWATFSCLGKLTDLLIGDRISLTSARAMTPSGRLDSAYYRVLGLTQNDLTGVGTCVAVEDVTIHSTPPPPG